MIYLDSSVALAQLFAEDRSPPESLWNNTLVSSRLLEYEVWHRANARGLGASHGDHIRAFLARIAFVELDRAVLNRALEPFPASVRTLDALHLASFEFMRSHGQEIRLATYDQRMLVAAKKLKFPTADL
jgi:predicted nucleic acid-binding protein